MVVEHIFVIFKHFGYFELVNSAVGKSIDAIFKPSSLMFLYVYLSCFDVVAFISAIIFI